MSARSNGSVRRLNSFGDAQRGERLDPDLQRALAALLHEHDLPVLGPHAEHVAVVGEVDHPAPRALVHLAGQVRQQVVAVDVDLVGHVAGLVARLQLLDDVRLAGGGEERRQPVMVLDDLVGDRARLDLAGPADHLRDPERAFPVGGLLAAERGRGAVRPGVHVRAVVGGVDDDGVLGDAEFVEQVEQLPDVAVVVDHRVVVGRLPAPRLAEALRLGVRPEVHVGHVHPDEERGARLVLALDEIEPVRRGPRRRWSPSASWSAVRCPRCAACRRGPYRSSTVVVVLVGRPGVDDAAGQKRSLNCGESSAGG